MKFKNFLIKNDEDESKGKGRSAKAGHIRGVGGIKGSPHPSPPRISGGFAKAMTTQQGHNFKVSKPQMVSLNKSFEDDDDIIDNKRK
jgi:hypothetical protein